MRLIGSELIIRLPIASLRHFIGKGNLRHAFSLVVAVRREDRRGESNFGAALTGGCPSPLVRLLQYHIPAVRSHFSHVK